MARRKSLLTPAYEREPEAPATGPIAPALAIEPAKKADTKKFHLGGYYDLSDPDVQAFRILSVTTNRRQQDLLLEAVRLLLDKHRAEEAFGK